MPRKTLDEQFQEGPPRRDADDSRDELNQEEKLYVLWGLKEEMSPKDIAGALGIDEAIVRQYQTGIVRNPEGLLNLAHFLNEADLDSAVQAWLRSGRRDEEPTHESPTADETHDVGPETEDEARAAAPQTQIGQEDAASVVPADADRSEIMQALHRLAALPDASESPEIAEPAPETTVSDAPVPQQPNLGDVDTIDMRSAFERMAERRGVTQDASEPMADSIRTGESQEAQPTSPSSGVRDSADTDPGYVDRTSEEDNGAQIEGDDRQRRRPRRVFGFLSGWARSANEERQRRDVVGGMGSVKEATSVSIESGKMKILSTRILDVLDYRVVPLSSQLYAGGVVVDAGTISRHLAAALADMKGAHRAVYAAVPGYQSAMRRLDLPDVREIDPKEVIPREARRALGVPVDNATIRWQRLPGRSRIARWLVAAASETSYTAISSVVRGTGHKIRGLELRPFALTRGTGHPTMICVFVSSDGCDVVVVREWEPHTYQSVYWETGSVSDGNDLVRRVSEVVENTIDLHNLHNPEVTLTPDVHMVVTGGETETHANLGMLVASNVGRNLVEAKNPLNAPSDFPYASMVVNVGLALWDI